VKNNLHYKPSHSNIDISGDPHDLASWVNKIEKNTPAIHSISASTDPAAGGIGGQPKMYKEENWACALLLRSC